MPPSHTLPQTPEHTSAPVHLCRQEAKLFSCLHIVVSVSWLAALLSSVDTLRGKRMGQLEQARIITNPPKREQIMALDVDGEGVDRLEFVVGMMMRASRPLVHTLSPHVANPTPPVSWRNCAVLGVELCGQPLVWDNLRPFLLQFDQFDVSKTGKLSHEDLKKYTDAIEVVQETNKTASPTAQKKWAGHGLVRAMTPHSSMHKPGSIDALGA